MPLHWELKATMANFVTKVKFCGLVNSEAMKEMTIEEKSSPEDGIFSHNCTISVFGSETNQGNNTF
jgi:hypothetical protein